MGKSNNSVFVRPWHGVIATLFVCLVFPRLLYAQLDTSPISGTIRLDQGVAESDLDITIELDIRSIVVNPDFSISFPVIDTVSANITLPAGQPSIAYSFNPLIVGGVRYSLNIRCSNCSNISPTVYYTQSGNAYRFSRRVILTRDKIPSTANFVLRTFSNVTGSIFLDNEKLARKDLNFGVSAFNSSTGEFLNGRAGFIIRKGTNSVTYRLIDVPRAVSPDGFTIEAVCFNCAAEQESFVFPQTINSSTNHSDINFIIPVSQSVVLPPIIDLLLE